MGKYSNALPPLCRIARIIGEKVALMGKYSTVMSHHLCCTYQVELPEVKVASNGEVH
jgi:hypothetical protein